MLSTDYKRFNAFAIFSIILICCVLTPVTFQNDTFYTIKIGESIMKYGVDMKDHFSWHKDLSYTYPHWAYDVMTYCVYRLGGFRGVYLLTMLFSCILGFTMYRTNVSLNKNLHVSWGVTCITIYLMRIFIAARAQLVTFTLFLLTILFIEKFIQERQWKYAIGLVFIALIIANVHVAVFPFFFILFLPYLAEWVVCTVVDSNFYLFILSIVKKIQVKRMTLRHYSMEGSEGVTSTIDVYKEKYEQWRTNWKDKNMYKVTMEWNKNIKILIPIMLACALMGLLTPLGDTPYTYLYKTMEGNTTEFIAEHRPLLLIRKKDLISILVLFISVITFTKVKIRFRDLCMFAGLLFLAFKSQRQISMFLLIGNLIFAKLIVECACRYIPSPWHRMELLFSRWKGLFLLLAIFSLISFRWALHRSRESLVDESSYPVQAADYLTKKIIPETGIKDFRLFNEYGRGSYLLYRNIPVFIDSRADLYAMEFNDTKHWKKKDLNERKQIPFDFPKEGKDIFTDYMWIGRNLYYEDVFHRYRITHLVLGRKSNLILSLSHDSCYKEIYKDKYFVIYRRNAD